MSNKWIKAETDAEWARFAPVAELRQLRQTEIVRAELARREEYAPTTPAAVMDDEIEAYQRGAAHVDFIQQRLGGRKLF